MKRYLFLFLAILLPISLEAQKRIGVDRIDATVGPSTQGDQPRILMQETAELGDIPIKVWGPWVLIDPNPPSLERPADEDGYIVVPGIRMSGWHKYRVAELDNAMAEADRNGLEVILGIHSPPTWPRGIKACEYDWAQVQPCGNISEDGYDTFRNALYDLTWYMANRYPQVKSWLLYNEPNLPYAFYPMTLLSHSLLDTYMYLVYEPMSSALHDVRGSDIEIVGPEITLLNVHNDFWSTKWLDDWILPILKRYPRAFDVISVHNYGIDSADILDKMDTIKKVLKRYPEATQRIWLTEYDIGTDKEKLTRTVDNVFLNLDVVRGEQWWERSFYFSFLNRLVSAKSQTFGQKLPLFDLFKALVQALP